jgi:sec-independent protein translocase protein TatA
MDVYIRIIKPSWPRYQADAAAWYEGFSDVDYWAGNLSARRCSAEELGTDMDLSGPHIIVLLVIVLLLFGSTRLPGAADALGKSMHIFKKSVKGLGDEGKSAPADGATVTQVSALPQPVAPRPQLPVPTPMPDATQQQLHDLQQQVQDLQRQAGGGDGTPVSGAPPSDGQRTQQPF